MHVNTKYQPEELIPLVSLLADKYTGYESTSITYEKAGQFMEAILYCLNEYELSGEYGLRNQEITAKEAYLLGYQMVVEKVKQLNDMYNELIITFQFYGNECLRDTVLKGIPEFLKWYDARYNPQDTILTLDYPILMDISHFSGIDAVFEYVHCICLEQKFLTKFTNEYIMEVLQSYSEDYELLIENIGSIVLQNVIGHMFLNKPLHQKGFTNEEYESLKKLFFNSTKVEMEHIIADAIQFMIDKLYNGDSILQRYLNFELENIAVRITNALKLECLDKVFLL